MVCAWPCRLTWKNHAQISHPAHPADFQGAVGQSAGHAVKGGKPVSHCLHTRRWLQHSLTLVSGPLVHAFTPLELSYEPHQCILSQCLCGLPSCKKVITLLPPPLSCFKPFLIQHGAPVNTLQQIAPDGVRSNCSIVYCMLVRTVQLGIGCCQKRCLAKPNRDHCVRVTQAGIGN